MEKKKIKLYLTNIVEYIFNTWIYGSKKIVFIKLSCGCVHNTKHNFIACSYHRDLILGDELEKLSLI